MYLNKNIHILSYSIMAAAFIRLATSGIEGIFRFFLNKDVSLAPDMMDTVLWRFQLASSVFKIVAIAGVFLYSWKRLSHYRSIVETDDYYEMGQLQKETFGDNLSSLSADAIGQLLQIWAVILTGAECVYSVSTIIYRRFTLELLLFALGGAGLDSFQSIYNISHGFKYLEMLTAILLGFFMTGIFLKDKRLMAVTVLIAAAFLTAFGVVQMQTFSLSGREVGIVWTSVIFHLTETIGLFLFSLYISRNYRGL